MSVEKTNDISRKIKSDIEIMVETKFNIISNSKVFPSEKD